MKRIVGGTVLSLALLAVFICLPFLGFFLCPAAEARTDSNSVSVDKAKESSVVVAKIGKYTITKDELRERLQREIRPGYDEPTPEDKAVTPESTLRDMVVEKAMIMEGRASGLLKDEILHDYIERTRQRKLIGAFLSDYFVKNVSVSAAEIEQAMKANSKFTREQAKARIQQAKARSLLEGLYGELVKKYEVKKEKDNFAKAVEIHERLLRKPATPRRETWIRNSQVREEVTDEEKKIPLATYKGGQVTVEDWLKALCEIVPPRRPRDLNTAEGVDKLLERALRPVIFAVEAQARGYGKNEKLRQEITELEDRSLLGKVRSEKIKDVNEPSDKEIEAYFADHKEQFAQSGSLQVEQLWFDDLASARKAKQSLDDGQDLASAKALASDKTDKPINLYPTGEGLFWSDLWKGEPNDVLGPMKGFHGSDIHWRIVKILEKKAPQPQEYSDAVKGRVKNAILTARREKLLAAYKDELLKKYPHELYVDRIKDIDPLEVTPPKPQQKAAAGPAPR